MCVYLKGRAINKLKVINKYRRMWAMIARVYFNIK